MNPFKLLNMDDSRKGMGVLAFSIARTDVVSCIYLPCQTNFFMVFLFTGLRFLRALRLIQFSEILQFLNILKTR